MWLEVERGEFLNDLIRTPSAAYSHQHVLTASRGNVVEQIDVEGVTNFVELGAISRSPIIITLNLNVGILAKLPAPASQDIAAADAMRPVEHFPGRWSIEGDGHPFPIEPLIDVTLHRERIASVQVRIQAEAKLARFPMVKVGSIGMELRPPEEAFAIHSVVEAFAVCASHADFTDALIDIPCAHGHERSVSIFRVFGDDVYDAIDCVRAPDRSAGASNHFDSLDVFKQGVLDLPIHASKERRIDASTVNQHQERLRELAPKSAYPHSPVVRIGSCHLQSGGEPQDLSDACGPGPPYVLLSDHIDRRRRPPDLFWLLGGSRHLDVTELF